VSYYSELFNRSGKAIRIEDCHTSPTHPDIASDGSVICPMNMCEKTAFLGHLYIKCIILPRQAWDKHRENSKTMPFSQVPGGR
jgi:hypothetical protein